MGDSQTDSDNRTDSDLLATLREDRSTSISLLGDFYRAEVDRATTWRGRLDQTTNWAVVVVAAILTWAFSSQNNPHYILLIGIFAVVTFLLIEAHRYQEYDIWRTRVRGLQKNLFVGILQTESSRDPDWQTELSTSLENPTFNISYRRAVAHRFRRMYLALLTILLIAWIVRITVFQTGESWRQTAGILGVDGALIVLVVVWVYVLLFAFTIWSAIVAESRELQE
jgi:uncharacterized membrane protein